MRRLVLIFAASIGWPVAAHADIYKCTDTNAVIYQSRPCAPGQSQTVVSVDKRPSQLASVVPVPPPRALPLAQVAGLAFRRTTIALGMSDDEVLNLPGWGVPRRIERSREGRVPRENWMYERSDGVRWLHFANARLTGMDAEDAPVDRVAGYYLR